MEESKGAAPRVMFFMCLLFALTVIIQLKFSCAAQGGDTLSLGASLRKNQTLISKNGTFELGFFNPNGTNKWYIGIWYARLSNKKVVWVANRNTPIKNAPGVLMLSTGGTLGLVDAEGEQVWSINGTAKATVATILDSGNFVMFGAENRSEIVWQSFKHPVDTWLPGMKIGTGRPLISWKNSKDPAEGAFSFLMDPTGAEQFVLRWNGRNGSVPYWESGIWDGKIFSNVPEMTDNRIYDIRRENSSSGVHFSYTDKQSMKFLSRFVLNATGEFGQHTLIKGNSWSLLWMQPRDQCSVYNLCGDYGICNSNNIQFCNCLERFKPQDSQAWGAQEWWSSGCVRQTPLSCSAGNGSSDGFMQVTSISSPDNSPYSYPSRTQQECEEVCLRNCSCTGYSYAAAGCQIWTESLLNMRNSHSRNDSAFFIRMATSELRRSSSSSRKTRIIGAVFGTIGAFVAIVAVIFTVFIRRRRGQLIENSTEADVSTLLRTFTYKELQTATNNFIHKLGSGSFGSVFKGTLRDNTVVAVKRLEGSAQTEKQFRAEISTIGKVNHKNVVRLLGFCIKGSQRLLVYEYVSNGSLNTFLFDKSDRERKMLDWKTRFGIPGAFFFSKSSEQRKMLNWKTRFEIALGTARALAYLHEKCRDRIIHCDIKPENILLDESFCTKVADFGLAKLMDRDFSRALTTIRGTRGYMAPEWISGVPITSKADVYSFGITLLELISGRRCLDFSVQKSSMYFLPAWATAQIERGNIIGIVDAQIADETDIEEVKRAAMVGLLCIQQKEDDRPDMVQVVKMLEGMSEAPAPQASPSPNVQVDDGDSDSSF